MVNRSFLLCRGWLKNIFLAYLSYGCHFPPVIREGGPVVVFFRAGLPEEWWTWGTLVCVLFISIDRAHRLANEMASVSVRLMCDAPPMRESPACCHRRVLRRLVYFADRFRTLGDVDINSSPMGYAGYYGPHIFVLTVSPATRDSCTLLRSF